MSDNLVFEMPIEDIKKRLKKMLSENRYNHSIGVMEASRGLSKIYGVHTGKAVLAGLLHDCARDLTATETFSICEKYGIKIDDFMKKQPKLLHGIVGSFIARDIFGVTSPDVLSAVENHTMGREGMDKLSAIVFVSDYIEDGRSFPGVEEIRRIAKVSLKKAVVACLDCSISYLISRGRAIHPQTVITRNWAIESE
jgi:predicted HD superfamily hydrolase involved in NAD metabolism